MQSNIVSVPVIRASIVTLFLLYIIEFGISSYIDIWIIIPAVRARIMPNIKLFMYFDKNKYASIAPNNSEKPAIKV